MATATMTSARRVDQVQEIRSSKRKRAPVTYYEINFNESDLEQFENRAVESEDDFEPSKKKRKSELQKVDSVKPLSKKKIFPWDKLPNELKNEIFDLCFTSPMPTFLVTQTKAYRHIIKREIMTPEHADGFRRRYRRWQVRYRARPAATDPAAPTSLPLLVPNLMLLNKETYALTQPMLYANNDFIVEDTVTMHHFLANIGTKNIATIKDLTLNGWGESRRAKTMNHPALTLLTFATNLERFYINCRLHYTGPRGVANQLFREGHHWLHQRGEAAIKAIDVSGNHLAPLYRDVGQKQANEKLMEEMRGELRKLMKVR